MKVALIFLALVATMAFDAVMLFTGSLAAGAGAVVVVLPAIAVMHRID